MIISSDQLTSLFTIISVTSRKLCIVVPEISICNINELKMYKNIDVTISFCFVILSHRKFGYYICLNWTQEAINNIIKISSYAVYLLANIPCNMFLGKPFPPTSNHEAKGEGAGYSKICCVERMR